LDRMVVEANGNIDVVGYSELRANETFSDTVTAKLDSDGNILWSRGADTFLGRGLAVDARGRVTMAGFHQSSVTHLRGLIVEHYDSDGTLTWGFGAANEGVPTVAVDADGAAFVSLEAGFTSGPGATYVFSPSGTLMWQTPTTGRAVVTDGSGGVYLVGPGITKYEHCTFNS